MTKKEIGNRLRQARLSSGKTQKEVASIIGRTQQIIGHWETGYSQPDANTIFVLCDIYGMSVSDVFGFNKDTTSVSDIKFLSRYHLLDHFGQETINIVLERETGRVAQLSEAKKIK